MAVTMTLATDDAKDYVREWLSWLAAVTYAIKTGTLMPDTAADLARIGHKPFEKAAAATPTAATVGAMARWEAAERLTRWDRMGIYHQPMTAFDRWLSGVEEWS